MTSWYILDTLNELNRLAYHIGQDQPCSVQHIAQLTQIYKQLQD
jgi:hypothetical protein